MLTFATANVHVSPPPHIHNTLEIEYKVMLSFGAQIKLSGNQPSVGLTRGIISILLSSSVAVKGTNEKRLHLSGPLRRGLGFMLDGVFYQ